MSPTFRCLLALALAASVQTLVTDNLLRNGSFDTDVLGWVDPTAAYPAGVWGRRMPGESGAIEIINEGATRSKMTTGKDTQIASISQCVLVRTDRRYELRARALAASGQPVGGYGAISITWFKNTSCDLKMNGSGLVQVFPPSARLGQLDDRWHDLRLGDVTPLSARRV